MCLETLKSRRDKAKLKWWHKLASMPVRRYPRQLFNQEWKVKPCRERQMKFWKKYVGELFEVLGQHEEELLDDIKKGQCPSSPFLSNVNECVSARESKELVKGMNSKVKLQQYITFGKEVDFKTYLHEVSDAGTRLLFQFRSGTHGLNEELSRHRGRNGKTECILCGDKCESVVYVLWECPAYKDNSQRRVYGLRAILGDAFKDNIEKASFVVGCELWTEICLLQ